MTVKMTSWWYDVGAVMTFWRREKMSSWTNYLIPGELWVENWISKSRWKKNPGKVHLQWWNWIMFESPGQFHDVTSFKAIFYDNLHASSLRHESRSGLTNIQNLSKARHQQIFPQLFVIWRNLNCLVFLPILHVSRLNDVEDWPRVF